MYVNPDSTKPHADFIIEVLYRTTHVGPHRGTPVRNEDWREETEWDGNDQRAPTKADEEEKEKFAVAMHGIKDELKNHGASV